MCLLAGSFETFLFAGTRLLAGSFETCLFARSFDMCRFASSFTPWLFVGGPARIIALPASMSMIVTLSPVILTVAAAFVAVGLRRVTFIAALVTIGAALIAGRRSATVDAITTVSMRVVRRPAVPVLDGKLVIVGRLDDAVEPFADRHAGLSGGFARSLARLRAQAS